MTPIQAFVLAIGFLAVGLWLLLPRGEARGRLLGAALSVFGIVAMILAGIFVGQLPPAESGGFQAVLWLLGGITVVSALGAVSMRSPVYCALWFALSLLGTAGLMLLIGAQFLALATVVVYAGAIVVTFLFVLMLAQPEGHAYYDRISWEASLSAVTGALIIGCLTAALSRMPFAVLRPDAATLDLRSKSYAAEEHVAELGARLFSEHLIAVEVAALLLMVSLIGATAMVRQRKINRGGPREAVKAAISGADGGDQSLNGQVLLHNYLLIGAILFGIGLVGLTARRNLIVMFLAAEIMLQGVSISFIAWGRFYQDWGGQMFVIFIIAIAACEAAVALALTVVLFHRAGNLDVAFWQKLREDSVAEHIDHELPAAPEEEQHWPELTPSGKRPASDPTKTPYRSHV